MKRQAIALLIHPYKDCLLPRKTLSERLNNFISVLVESGNRFPNIRFNLALPGYFLEALDPLLLLKLREMHKRNQMEWLFTGYTEPFPSFSPPWLLSENFKYGMTVYNDLTGTSPAGLALPFSNWEPSAIDIFKSAGIHYCTVSKVLLSEQYRPLLGYWLTENMGSSIALVPTTVVSHPEIVGFFTQLERLFDGDGRGISSEKMLCIDMLYSLSQPAQNADTDWTIVFSKLDALLLSFQTVRCAEFISSQFALGLNYLHSDLVLKRDDAKNQPQFLNELHTYDQVGIIQRKMMDIAENIALRKDSKPFKDLTKTLFFVQDINHYLPSATGGFQQARDRSWCYSKMIEIEKELFAKEEIKGGHIRITDLLKNGNKTILMSNKSLALSIDYKNGGQVFELDYKTRNHNLCSTLGASRHTAPMIVEAPRSKTAFIDHCLPVETGIEDFAENRFLEYGDFVSADFGYKIKKTGSGIKAVLHRNGTLVQGEKNCPLVIEKALGLEKDFPVLSFAYQITNRSLANYAFRFAAESGLSLPGLADGTTCIIQGKTAHAILDTTRFSMEGITEWAMDDRASGILVHFVMNKPVDVWCIPIRPDNGHAAATQAITIVISAPVSLEGSKAWSLIGTLELKKTRVEKEFVDEI